MGHVGFLAKAESFLCCSKKLMATEGQRANRAGLGWST